jgi:hypothetical protein
MIVLGNDGEEREREREKVVREMKLVRREMEMEMGRSREEGRSGWLDFGRDEKGLGGRRWCEEGTGQSEPVEGPVVMWCLFHCRLGMSPYGICYIILWLYIISIKL